MRISISLLVCRILFFSLSGDKCFMKKVLVHHSPSGDFKRSSVEEKLMRSGNIDSLDYIISVLLNFPTFEKNFRIAENFL